MYIKTTDGLVHQAAAYETDDRYGKTRCETMFTQDPKYVALSVDVFLVKTAKPPTTCLVCIARSTG